MPPTNHAEGVGNKEWRQMEKGQNFKCYYLDFTKIYKYALL